MPRYRNRVTRVVVSLADDHRVTLGSDWVKVGDKPAPETRRSKAKAVTDKS